MSEQNSYLIEVDGHEYDLEVIGDEVVVTDFAPLWANLCGAFQGESDALRRLVKPHESLFSFTATPALKSLIFEANDWFDTHGENANEAMDAAITEMATPHIRAFQKKALHSTGDGA